MQVIAGRKRLNSFYLISFFLFFSIFTCFSLLKEGVVREMLFKVFKTLAGDGFQTLQTGGGYYGASRPAGQEENEFIKINTMLSCFG